VKGQLLTGMTKTYLSKFVRLSLKEAMNSINPIFDPVRPEDLMDDPEENETPNAIVPATVDPESTGEIESEELSARPTSIDHVAVKNLPSSLQSALAGIGFHKPDISVESVRGYYLSGAPDNGTRNIVAAVNLTTSAYKIEMGSWGGGNPFERKQVDLDGTVRRIPMKFAIIKGTNQGSKTISARILINPEDIQQVLPEKTETEISEKEKIAINIIGGIKSGYRADLFSRHGLGPYKPENPIIQSMLAKQWIKIGAGVQITTLGKNIRLQHKINNL
jgi:hypothetical protein